MTHYGLPNRRYDWGEQVTTALVLSAGGMWAAWEVGVWMALRSRFQPDLIVGASAGSWIGWAIAGGCSPQDLIDEWMNPRVARIMSKRPIGLQEAARDLFARFRPRVPFGLTLVELPWLRSRLVRGPEVTPDYLAASCSIPLIFPPVATAGKWYVDGGLRGALPLWAAEEMGATRAIALNVLNTFHFRVLRMVLPPRRATSALEVLALEPSVPLGSIYDAVVWSPDRVKRWIEQGERDGNRFATSITM